MAQRMHEMESFRGFIGLMHILYIFTNAQNTDLHNHCKNTRSIYAFL